MGKKRKPHSHSSSNHAVRGSSKPDQADDRPQLQELLGADMVRKLKAQAEEMKQEETRRKEEIRKQEEERRQQERKALENDFAYLLEHSDVDWRKHK